MIGNACLAATGFCWLTLAAKNHCYVDVHKPENEITSNGDVNNRLQSLLCETESKVDQCKAYFVEQYSCIMMLDFSLTSA